MGKNSVQAVQISLKCRKHTEFTLWKGIKKMKLDFSQPSGRIPGSGHKLKRSKFHLL